MFPIRRTIAPILAISIALAFLISPIAIVASSNAPNTLSDIIESNISQGNITLFSQNYSDSSSIPSNAFVSLEPFPEICNATLGYNYAKGALNFSADKGEVGSLYIAGLTPMEKTTYHMEIGLERSSSLSESYIRFPGGSFIYKVSSLGRNRIISSLNGSTSMNLGHAEDNRVALDIILDSRIDTFRVKYNESSYIDIPWSETRQRIPYDTFTGSFLAFNSYVSASDTTVSTLIYNITQTAPRSYVTPLGAKKLTAFGLDLGSQLSTVQNGVAAVTEVGGKGTVWFDVGHEFMTNDTELAFYLDLINNHSWEVGIHFSSKLTSMTMNDATALMQSEYNQITSRLGVAPKTWCSLSGAENITLAIWAYTNLGMLWRSSDIGTGMLNLIGNLWTDTIPWWIEATSAGLVVPAFTHETDVNPPTQYSLNLSNFNKWVDGYTSSGIEITSFYDWYMTNLNAGDGQATNIMANNRTATFTMSTNGARCYVNVNYHATAIIDVLDQGIGSINHTVEPDGSISFWTENGHTYIIGSADYTLKVNIVGNGTVSKSPDQASYVYGAVVTLTPIAEAGWTFSSWGANVVGGKVTITSDTTVTAIFILPAIVPSAPQTLIATAGNAQITLTWTAPANDGGSSITAYKVYRGTTSGGETLLVTLGNVITFTDNGLTNGKTYYYKVSAVNSAGESPLTEEVAATSNAPSPDGGDNTLVHVGIGAVAIAALAGAAFVVLRKRR